MMGMPGNPVNFLMNNNGMNSGMMPGMNPMMQMMMMNKPGGMMGMPGNPMMQQQQSMMA